MRRSACFAGLLFLLIAVFGAACWPFGDDDNTIIITDKDDGITVNLAKGDHLTVRLGSNITTGFRWYVGEMAGPELKFSGEAPYEEPAKGTPSLGAPGTQVFNFGAVSSGKVQVAMEYRQGFNPGVPAAKTFHFTVDIR